jgi:hypothetical protein
MPESGTSGSVRGRDGKPPGLLDRQFFWEGAPFNSRRDRSRRELRVDSGVRGTQHASRHGMPWGVKPGDNVPASASHTADDRATPATYADDEEPAEASLKKTGVSG